MQAHIISDVVMDIAAFKVSHSAGCDIDATALQAARGEVKLHRGAGCKFKDSSRGSSHRDAGPYRILRLGSI